jgi:hypothetical protein
MAAMAQTVKHIKKKAESNVLMQVSEDRKEWCVTIASNWGLQIVADAKENAWWGFHPRLLTGHQMQRLATCTSSTSRFVLSPCTPPLEPVGCSVVQMLQPEPALAAGRAAPEHCCRGGRSSGYWVGASHMPGFFKNGVSFVFRILSRDIRRAPQTSFGQMRLTKVSSARSLPALGSSLNSCVFL